MKTNQIVLNENIPKGIKNLGKTCYMNSGIQTIFLLSEIINLFKDKIENLNNENDQILKSFLELYRLKNTQINFLDPTNFRENFIKKYKAYSKLESNDSLFFIFDLIEYLNSINNNVNELLNIQKKQIVKCTICNKEKIIYFYDKYLTLQLPKENNIKDIKTIYNLKFFIFLNKKFQCNIIKLEINKDTKLKDIKKLIYNEIKCDLDSIFFVKFDNYKIVKKIYLKNKDSNTMFKSLEKGKEICAYYNYENNQLTNFIFLYLIYFKDDYLYDFDLTNYPILIINQNKFFDLDKIKLIIKEFLNSNKIDYDDKFLFNYHINENCFLCNKKDDLFCQINSSFGYKSDFLILYLKVNKNYLIFNNINEKLKNNFNSLIEIKNNVTTLNELIQNEDTCEEILYNIYCQNCRKFCEVIKMTRIIKLPYYLVIKLNRINSNKGIGENPFFNMISKSYLNKNESLIYFPYNLEIFNQNYELISVIYHEMFFGFGHFYSICKQKDEKWYKCDDKKIEFLIKKDKILNKNAYILFYQQKN